MLTVDGMHTRESNGDHALILSNITPFDGTHLRYRDKSPDELHIIFGEFCSDICIGTVRTFFEFPKDVTQETIDKFTEMFNKTFNLNL